ERRPPRLLGEDLDRYRHRLGGLVQQPHEEVQFVQHGEEPLAAMLLAVQVRTQCKARCACDAARCRRRAPCARTNEAALELVSALAHLPPWFCAPRTPVYSRFFGVGTSHVPSVRAKLYHFSASA